MMIFKKRFSTEMKRFRSKMNIAFTICKSQSLIHLPRKYSPSPPRTKIYTLTLLHHLVTCCLFQTNVHVQKKNYKCHLNVNRFLVYIQIYREYSRGENWDGVILI